MVNLFFRRRGAAIGWGVVGGGCIALPFIVPIGRLAWANLNQKHAHLIADELATELSLEEYERVLKED